MKNILIGLALLVVVGGGVWFSKRNTVDMNLVPGATTYTIAQVASHNSSTSCWSTVNGGVYDLTSWVSNHPGGEQAILQICGKDGSVAFNGQHGGQVEQATVLSSFKIGIITQ
jgi:cytochrome b involved in lipid metabolism